jgi:hypothetical protein
VTFLFGILGLFGEFLNCFFADMGQKQGKRLCKSLIIKVFQRSRGLNFTNGTWNKNFDGVLVL